MCRPEGMSVAPDCCGCWLGHVCARIPQVSFYRLWQPGATGSQTPRGGVGGPAVPIMDLEVVAIFPLPGPYISSRVWEPMLRVVNVCTCSCSPLFRGRRIAVTWLAAVVGFSMLTLMVCKGVCNGQFMLSYMHHRGVWCVNGSNPAGCATMHC